MLSVSVYGRDQSGICISMVTRFLKDPPSGLQVRVRFVFRKRGCHICVRVVYQIPCRPIIMLHHCFLVIIRHIRQNDRETCRRSQTDGKQAAQHPPCFFSHCFHLPSLPGPFIAKPDLRQKLCGGIRVIFNLPPQPAYIDGKGIVIHIAAVPIPKAV